MVERAQYTEREGQLPYSDRIRHLYSEAMQELLGGREPDAFAPVALGDDVFTLVIVDNAAHEVRILLESARVETRFLGRLHGDYRESTRLTDRGGLEITMTFEDERLQVPLELKIVPIPANAHVNVAGRSRLDELDKVRAKLREWASTAEPR